MQLGFSSFGGPVGTSRFALFCTLLSSGLPLSGCVAGPAGGDTTAGQALSEEVCVARAAVRNNIDGITQWVLREGASQASYDPATGQTVCAEQRYEEARPDGESLSVPTAGIPNCDDDGPDGRNLICNGQPVGELGFTGDVWDRERGCHSTIVAYGRNDFGGDQDAFNHRLHIASLPCDPAVNLCLTNFDHPTCVGASPAHTQAVLEAACSHGCFMNSGHRAVEYSQYAAGGTCAMLGQHARGMDDTLYTCMGRRTDVSAEEARAAGSYGGWE